MKIIKIYLFILSLYSFSLYSQVSQQWAARQDYGFADWSYSIATDYAGNVYICGTKTVNNAFLGDIATIKYSPTGTKLWEAVYNDTANLDDRASAIAVDSAGNVYVVGSAMLLSSSPAYGMVLIKYNTNGVQQWTAHNYTDSSYIFGMTLKLDNTGNIYVGEKFGTFVSGNGALSKYNSSGMFQWRTNTGRVYAIAIDDSGNPIASGTTPPFKYFVAKFNTSGVLQWQDTSAGPCNGCDGPDAIAVDAGRECVSNRSCRKYYCNI